MAASPTVRQASASTVNRPITYYSPSPKPKQTSKWSRQPQADSFGNCKQRSFTFRMNLQRAAASPCSFHIGRGYRAGDVIFLHSGDFRRSADVQLSWVPLNIPSGISVGFPGGGHGNEPACQCRRHKRHGFDPWVGKIPRRRAWQPTPVFLPGEPHGQRSLVGYRTWGRKESDTTEAT